MGKINSSFLRYFVLWLIVPIGTFYIYKTYPPVELNWLNLCVFSVLGFLSVYYPIQRKGIPTFLVMWVTVPVFLMYGLFAEIIVMQIAIISSVFRYKSNNHWVKRVMLNSTIFFFLSLSAAMAFIAVGAEIGSMNFWLMITGVLAYQITHTVLNDLVLRIYSTYKKIENPYITKEILMDYAIIIVIIPLALSLYFLLQLVGLIAFVLLGAPYFFITFLTRLYENTEKVNISLQLAGEVGSGLSALKTEKEVIDQFCLKGTKMFNADYGYVFDFNNGWLELIRAVENGELVDIDLQPMLSGQGLAESVLEKNESFIYKSRNEWEVYSKFYTPDDMESVLCVPITRNRKIEAVLLLGSKKKIAFRDYQLQILDLLCSYFTVSVEKARYMEETVNKSERCALTSLYNYRYLEERLQFEMNRVHRKHIESLSVVMLDIDHFKNVNDTYGHECGNEILKQFALELKKAMPKDGIVARYGGEEFVYLLPGMNKMDAINFAENLRVTISQKVFYVKPDLEDSLKNTGIQITSSIGVSSAPDDTDEGMALLRNADRALYIGAKQAGRNRVAEYIK